jgi:hypothetical protein
MCDRFQRLRRPITVPLLLSALIAFLSPDLAPHVSNGGTSNPFDQASILAVTPPATALIGTTRSQQASLSVAAKQKTHHDAIPGSFTTPGLRSCWYINESEFINSLLLKTSGHDCGRAPPLLDFLS